MSDSPSESVQVLYVDDCTDWLELVETYLEREQDRLSVQGETSAEVALEILRTTSIDAVLSDFEMPVMNGLEFLDQVRTDHPDIPFILYTGQGSDEFANEAVSRGGIEFIQKESSSDHFSILAHRILTAVERRE